MNNSKRFYQQLTHYLNRKESASEKQELTEWYAQKTVEREVDDSLVKTVQQKAKVQLWKSIKDAGRVKRIRKRLIWSTAAAAMLIMGYWGANYILSMQPQPASSALLASIEPAKARAIIQLADGTIIDLDKLSVNERIQEGQTIITKDSKGEVTYQDAVSGQHKVQMNSIQIPKASTYKLTLADGTKVTLNSESKLTYPTSFDVGDRVVQLEGEGYFEVTKSSKGSRFIVASENQRIQVLGTKFNIKAYPQDHIIKTTLAEGSIQLSTFGSVKKTVLLKPSQQALLSNESLSTKTVDIADVLSWVNGEFYFDGSNTEDVLEEVARWYDIHIEYARKANLPQFVGKIPRNLSLDRLVELLNYAELQTKAVVDKNKQIRLIIT